MGVFLAAQNAMDQLWDVPSSAGLTPCATARPRSFSLMTDQPATRADKRALTQGGKIEERRQDETVSIDFPVPASTDPDQAAAAPDRADQPPPKRSKRSSGVRRVGRLPLEPRVGCQLRSLTDRHHPRMSGRQVASVCVRYAVAGAAAGLGWRAVEPVLRRLFGHPYSDPELLTAFITRGVAQRPLDYLVQGTGGAAFGWAFARLGGRTTRQAVAASLGENALLLAAAGVVDRYHPDVRDGSWPPLAGNPRAAGVSVSGHLLYGVLLGMLAKRR